MGGMIPFDEFIECLGPDARLYTKEQLEQLRIEVRKLAEVLLVVHRARSRERRISGSPQPDLDESGADRTIRDK